MRTSFKARLGALTATAVLATSGAMAVSGVADAAVHPAIKRLPTTLSVRASAPVTRHHLTFARVSGRLSSHHVGLRHKVVWLERQGPKGHWFVVQRERTHRHGVVVYRVHERKTSSFRLVFRGSPNFKRSVSAVVTIKAGK